MNQRILSQKEIDELFARYAAQPLPEDYSDLLTAEQLDIIGEIGNICMGTAATTLSQIIGKKVTIGYPDVIVCRQEEVFRSFSIPYLIVMVGFKSGLSGFNVLVITEEDVAVIANMMMCGTGDIQHPVQLTEMEISAVEEVMNQMIGSASTAMAELFNVTIDITPPQAIMVRDLVNASHTPLPTDQPVVVARFATNIGDIIKTTIMQITSVDAAREQANYLIMKAGYLESPWAEENKGQDKKDKKDGSGAAEAEVSGTVLPASLGVIYDRVDGLPALGLALSLPTELTVVLARINCRLAEVAALQEGSSIELGKVTVDIYAGGALIGRGDLVKDEQGNYRVIIHHLFKSALLPSLRLPER